MHLKLRESSKAKLQRHLYHTWIYGCRQDAPERRRVFRERRVREIRVVQKIERLRAKIEMQALHHHRKLFDDGKVEVRLPGSFDNADTGVPKGRRLAVIADDGKCIGEAGLVEIGIEDLFRR